MTNPILLESNNGIATITLNRPESLNALDKQLAIEFLDSLKKAKDDPNSNVLVIRGAGKAFMAGGDIKIFHQATSSGNSSDVKTMVDKIITLAHESITIISTMPKPVIASVHGSVAGIGLSLALACDLVISASETVFTLAYPKIGASPDGSSTYSLPRMVGLKKAMELALFADIIQAEEAKELGLVNWVVSQETLLEETAKIASRLNKGPKLVYGEIKQLLRQSLDNTLSEQLKKEEASFHTCAQHPDFAEGVDAFISKRKAEFK